MLNGHSMLFRLSLALLSRMELGAGDAEASSEPTFATVSVPAGTPSALEFVLERARAVGIESIIGAAFSDPDLVDVERDFTRYESLCKR